MSFILTRLKMIALTLVATVVCAKGEVILQYFGTSWAEIERRIPELAERGYESLWLPPPFKGGAGTYSVGFDTFDRFDLGDRDGSGTIRTKYGTKAELLSMMRTAHRFGLRVYFDNVMAHNAGPLDKNTEPGNLFPGIPGFVPEDFHIVREADGTWRKPGDWPNWNDEWQVLNRNPFAWDIANEYGTNVSFNPGGLGEAHSYPKWSGIRHPGRHGWYLDTDLVVGTNYEGFPVHPFANKEPFEDVGFFDGTNWVGAANGRFDWLDANGNGQHDLGEVCEPFSDTGVDPSVSWRRTPQWGYGDGRYNMGNIVSEDVNAMLYRSVRWFIDQASPDGFRLDAVKHVPSGFFGKQDGADKDYVNWGYIGQIQEQYNISRGFSDWNNHRDSVFNSEYQARDDAMLFGEHLGSPPGESGYLNAGMRIANDNLLNTVKSNIGSSLVGFDQVNYGGWGTTSTSTSYIMSHDNTHLWGGDRSLAHAYMITREGQSIVYTDGYNQAGAPDYFPKPSGINFLGQFGDNSIVSAIELKQDFARGYQVPRWSDQNFAAYERVDEREKKSGAWNGQTMLFMMARNYQPNGQARNITTGFPVGATLINRSPHGGAFRVYVNPWGNVVDGSGNPPIVPPNGWFAFTWHTPGLPLVWQAGRFKQERAAIEIEQNGAPVPMMDHWRTDGRDGDTAFNPYGMSAGDTATRSYRVRIPRVTSGENLSFIARADGSAGNILMKLDGGMDINSQLGIGPQGGDLRDVPPGINGDLLHPSDNVKQSATDTYVGYEQMKFMSRSSEKFAARNIARNVIGSPGAESYETVIGTAGFTINDGVGPNDSSSRNASWVYHDPEGMNQEASPVKQMYPQPENAANVPVDIWVKVGYQNQADRVRVYYTTDGITWPEGSDGTGKGSTQIAWGTWVSNAPSDGVGTPDWWRVTLPPMPDGTVLRYKVAVRRSSSTQDIFPFDGPAIDLAERMETRFAITNFNATTARYYVHNDYGTMATGLEEGFHVLRSRAFVSREDGASIYKTNTQVFYYDLERPVGVVLYPSENDTLGGSSYGVVVRTDPSVTEVWYYVDDLNPSNDNPATGNGVGNWKKAVPITTRSAAPGDPYPLEWRFEYVDIPNSGEANIVVRLKEASSSSNMGLSDEDGWMTTLVRHVNTGSSINFNIGIPTTNGETVNRHFVMRTYFKKELIPLGMTDEEFLDEVSIYISSTISGQPDYPVLQPRSEYHLDRDVNDHEHSISFTFPNLYNGDPDFLHTVRIEHQRGTLTLGDSTTVRMAIDETTDADGDGLPDFWERFYGFDPYNSTGRHGPDGDDDEDGFTNLQEFLAGMNPLEGDGELYPRIEIAPNFDWVGEVYLYFPSIPNRRYRVEYSHDLVTWYNWVGDMVTTGQPANPRNTWIDNGNSTSPHPKDVPLRYYRLRLSMP